VIEGPWVANVGVLVLVVLATVAGLTGLLGRVGLGLAAARMVLVGNAWSGVSSAPELLPGWVGTTGQLLLPGAGAGLLRSTAFFDGATPEGPVGVLIAWAALGLPAIAVAHRRRRSTSGVVHEIIGPLARPRDRSAAAAAGRS
jgi:hypothetical protein